MILEAKQEAVASVIEEAAIDVVVMVAIGEAATEAVLETGVAEAADIENVVKAAVSVVEAKKQEVI